jgi:putative mRNA 3-end processing factor
MPLLKFNKNGIYCAQADVYIDPWKPVKRALITHAHADHSRSGHKYYLAHKDSETVMRLRLGAEIVLETVEYAEVRTINGVQFSFHPAGHIPGSAQIRVEYKGEVWVVSGDYKVQEDGLSVPFEPVPCQHFVTESTFGLPIYRWEEQPVVMDEINQWWQSCKEKGKVAVIGAYSLGKAQRVINHVDHGIGRIFTHGAVENTNAVLREGGIHIAPTTYVSDEFTKKDFAGSLVVCPPGALGTPWMRRLGPAETAFASGWMALRGARRRRAADRGFVLSDHADWDGLNKAVLATGAENIYVTHGYQSIYTKWLIEEYGLNAVAVSTLYEGEGSEDQEGKEASKK